MKMKDFNNLGKSVYAQLQWASSCPSEDRMKKVLSINAVNGYIFSAAVDELKENKIIDRDLSEYEIAGFISVELKSEIKRTGKFTPAMYRIEHMVPKKILINMLLSKLEDGTLTEEETDSLIRKYYHVALITRNEDKYKLGGYLKSNMPKDWDGEDIFARYKVNGIEVEEYDALCSEKEM